MDSYLFVVFGAALAEHIQTCPAPVSIFGAVGLSKRFEAADIYGAVAIVGTPSVPLGQQAVYLLGQRVYPPFQLGNAFAVGQPCACGGCRLLSRLPEKAACTPSSAPNRYPDPANGFL